MTNPDPDGLPHKIVALHDALADGRLAHAFGGALALAWCTERARGTIDIDVNVFIDPVDTVGLVAALPTLISCTDSDQTLLERDGQVRLWWRSNPVDVFLNTTDFHRQVATRIRWEPFLGRDIPFLGCADLAVFKAFFNRTKDWADLEDMHTAGALDIPAVTAVLSRYLGDDDRVDRLRSLGSGRPPGVSP